MIKTAESVSPKHPDKMCDQISDAILDHCLEQDPEARVAVETVGGHGKVFILGEVTLKGSIKPQAVRDIVKRITGQELEVTINIVEQSREIANGVDTGGAGDQGIMIGFASNQSPDLIPIEVYLARSLCKYIYEQYPYDGKTQITMDGSKIVVIVASFQNVSKAELEKKISDWIMDEKNNFKVQDFSDVKVYANPAGDWKIGGFDADTGLTGRKIIVDAYGPQMPIGGGAFSGKDASKVDRSGAYIARLIAVNNLVKYKADSCMVKLAYAIGVAEPVMATLLLVDQRGTIREVDLLKDPEIVKKLTPKGIRETLKLNRPQFEQTARWGHFGNSFIWDY